MRNDKELTTALYEAVDVRLSDSEYAKLLALIHEERAEAAKGAGAAAGLVLESFQQEKTTFRKYVDDIQKQMKTVHATLGGALKELDTLDYRTMKDKTLLKSDVLREYFRVMNGILPPTA